ncbi:MAG: hypothetical protein KDC38_19795, partial [Planctomycetes bacterium]|nr:hypothetical protein [Planctomycetota bacterium]
EYVVSGGAADEVQKAIAKILGDASGSTKVEAIVAAAPTASVRVGDLAVDPAASSAPRARIAVPTTRGDASNVTVHSSIVIACDENGKPIAAPTSVDPTGRIASIVIDPSNAPIYDATRNRWVDDEGRCIEAPAGAVLIESDGKICVPSGSSAAVCAGSGATASTATIAPTAIVVAGDSGQSIEDAVVGAVKEALRSTRLDGDELNEAIRRAVREATSGGGREFGIVASPGTGFQTYRIQLSEPHSFGGAVAIGGAPTRSAPGSSISGVASTGATRANSASPAPVSSTDSVHSATQRAEELQKALDELEREIEALRGQLKPRPTGSAR